MFNIWIFVLALLEIDQASEDTQGTTSGPDCQVEAVTLGKRMRGLLHKERPPESVCQFVSPEPPVR